LGRRVVAPADALVDVRGISPDVAAVLQDAVSTPWAAITQTGEIRPGKSATVWESVDSAAAPSSFCVRSLCCRSSRSIPVRRRADVGADLDLLARELVAASTAADLSRSTMAIAAPSSDSRRGLSEPDSPRGFRDHRDASRETTHD
jgi:hypothetical protein